MEIHGTAIGFSRSRKWLSRLICWITKSAYSHVFIIFFDETLSTHMVFESSLKGPAFITLDEFMRNHENIKIIKPSVDLLPGIRRELRNLDKNYDIPGLIGMGWVVLGKRFFHKAWKNPFNTSGLWCSELAAKVLKSSEYPNHEQLNPSTTSPQDLVDFLNG